MSTMKSYLQGAIGAFVVVVVALVVWGAVSHYWVDRWQSDELYRLRVRAEQAEKIQVEVVKWINNVQQQAQQQAQRQQDMTKK